MNKGDFKRLQKSSPMFILISVIYKSYHFAFLGTLICKDLDFL